MRISTDSIKMDNSLHAVEQKVEKGKVEKESLTKEHKKKINIAFEYRCVQ